MPKTLRPYQQEALNTLLKRLKETTHPLLVTASVGAGKSLIISQLLLVVERANMSALCLTLNSTLIEQNAHTYNLQNGNAGIYCAGLKSKSCKELVIFGSPHSVLQGIRNEEDISRKKFNIIIVDECHNISPLDEQTMFRIICNHYGRMAQEEQYSFRIVGLTGTPYRGKGHSIVGPDQFFKEEVCNIKTGWLISQGYLVRPYFGLIDTDAYDFSQLRVNNTGNFNSKELQAVVDKNKRLTNKIMAQLQVVMQNHVGAFIFAATRKHCEECASSLPIGKWAIITGETPHEERKRILDRARSGSLRYLISVNCLNVGVDVPSFDLCAWLRPTESLVLYTQGIGRVLRLHEGKSRATVLDYAGNLDRHGDIDDPIINEALKPQPETERDYVIPCYTCSCLNTVHARRCIGTIGGKRCDHYFEFVDCPKCQTKNDITTRHCRGCNQELIDPNKKLSITAITTFKFSVIQAEYWISTVSNESILNASYQTSQGKVFESYSTISQKSRNVLYANFVRHHIEKPSQYYMKLQNNHALRQMIKTARTPHTLICTKDEYGRYQVKSKLFN